MQKVQRILLTGGGSGGHIQPNLAIVTELKVSSASLKSQVEILYVGSRKALDRQLVKAANIPFKAIFTGKLRRYFSWQNFIDPFFVLIGFLQSFWIVIRFWPHVVFSKGGYVSVPVVIAAFILRRPIILHESDSVMGLANRLVSRMAKKVCVSFPDVVKDEEKTIFTGNPVRLEIQNGSSEKGYKLTGFRPERPVLLVWGGSQGAQQINDMIVNEFHSLKSLFQIIHVTGKDKQTTLNDVSYIQYEYLGEELKHIYAITDLVVSRAGANSIYELALMQKPNVLIPLKNKDQLKNALYFQQKGGSVILEEGQSLFQILSALWHNPEQIELMKKALSGLAKPDAADKIAQLILQESGHRTQDTE